MESEGSLPCSQKPANGPCSEPEESSPHSHTQFMVYINIILPLTSMSSNGLCLSDFPIKNFVCICYLTHMHYVPRLSYYSVKLGFS
jgi:hypothetical protein